MYFARRVHAISSTVVISQVYGGGGNSGATYRNDFIELFNKGTTAVNLAGWTVQYASSGGTSWTNITALSGTLQPGQYYLIQEAAGTGGTINLPTPDASGNIAMSATAGKVALVNSITALTGTGCPFGATVVDFIGYGAANCSETSPASGLTNTTSARRAGDGCTDSDNNSVDFSTGSPTPRNSASATNTCPVVNQPITPNCPPSLSTSQGTATSASVSATDPDGTVTSASITSTPVPGITLDNFVAAPNNNTAATATLNVANTTAVGNYNVTIQYSNNDSPTPQTATCTVAVSVTAGPTNPSGVGLATPNSVLPGEVSKLTVNVTLGTNPTSTGIVVTADLSSIGGSSSQQLFDDGSNGDATPNNNVFTYDATVSISTTSGPKSLPFSISDAELRSGSGSISLTVQTPPPPPDHVVISQIYGGGGNSGATYTNDYVELYNPTGISFNLAGWSLQYGSATGTTWTNNQPLGGIIAPGEYYLVGLGSGGAVGSPLPAPNISGSINMSATAGKIVLVNNSTPLSGACPIGSDPDIVDFVGYGTTANCFEGGGRAPAASNTTALFRKSNGAQDTDQNNADFVTGAPNPRRTSPIQEIGPWVAFTDPGSSATVVPYDATMSITFSEAMDVADGWYDITCAATGQHNSATIASSNSSKTYAITPNTSFQFGEQCTVTIFKDQVHDQDLDDSTPGTDTLPENYIWSFTVVLAGDPAPYPPSVHLTMGNPSNAVADLLTPNNYLMEKPTYATSYNRDKGTPNWVSWHLDTSWFGSLARVDTFRPDPRVSPDWYRVQATDYFSSGFDRGHMTPNADRDNENRVPINQETYLMTNMVPQAPDNNQGPWADMENDLRSALSGETNEIYIISGPLGLGGTGSNGGTTNTLAGGHVTVPAFTWKVALVLPKGDNDVSRVTASTRTIAVIMPNVQGIRDNDWHFYLTTVDAVEQQTGYDFFANVPDAIENAIEAGTNGDNPPGTADQSAVTPEDSGVSITLNAVSPSPTPSFTYTIVSSPTHGTLTGSGANRTYTPDLDFYGTDSFTFNVNDGSHTSNTSTVHITITEVNDDPVANTDNQSTNEDTALNFSAADLTLNDSTGPANESSQALTVASVTPGGDTHGSVTLTNGSISYSPDQNYNGAASFGYQVCDDGNTNGAPDSKCSLGTVNVTVNPVNDAPVANNDSYSTNSNTALNIAAPGVLGNDTDIDADSLTSSVVIASGPSHGTLTLNLDGSFSYMPVTDYTGADGFSYTAYDGTVSSNAATVAITVNDTVGPYLNSSVAMSLITSTNSNLFNVGLAASATDNGGGPVTISVAVFGDEDDQTATLPGMVHSPDAKDIAPTTLRLRGERVEANDGRVYLIVITATDNLGNITRNYQTVVVPKNNKQASVDSVNAQAAAAVSYAQSHGGAPPPGYFVIGDGPIIGPKQ